MINQVAAHLIPSTTFSVEVNGVMHPAGTEASVGIYDLGELVDSNARFLVYRTRGEVNDTFAFNELTSHFATEAEAREVANEYWTDAVQRARSVWYQTTGETAKPKPEPKPVPVLVPAGRYAVAIDDEPLGFFVVDRPTEGRWAGYVFVKQMASDTEYPVRGGRKARVLQAIVQDTPMRASLRYGKELGVCGVCGRTLTDENSRAQGIGPICAAKMGW